ncbi:hypothetical protein CASFOL_004717 [Castilleja foliolosa]|uniref:Uncharacterized protein n=1 Tax=Castilleja foliolosa TaxID=1961234 RepID=A0ABD3EF09_9LAMI
MLGRECNKMAEEENQALWWANCLVAGTVCGPSGAVHWKCCPKVISIHKRVDIKVVEEERTG